MVTSRARWWCAAIVLAAGCASATGFKTTWKNPDAGPIRLTGQKVVVFVRTTDETTRRAAEDVIAAQITARGAQGVASWTILPTADMQNEEKARLAMSQAGAAAVVTMEALGDDRDRPNVRMAFSGGTMSSRSFWGHYGSGWSSTWYSGPAPNKDVLVDTLVHSLQPEALLWTGRSRTVTARNVAGVFREVASEAAREMERAGLLAGPRS